MKLAECRQNGRRFLGLVDTERSLVRPLENGSPKSITGMLDLIARFDTLRSELADSDGAGDLPLDAVEFAAPIPRPARNIFCVGKNYHAHAHEFTRSGFDSSAAGPGDAVPEEPIIFTKPPECIIGPNAPIQYPHGVSNQVDYEAELAVVIGRGGRQISAEAAYDHVWGYTIINDVTARDWQSRHKQWFLGKAFDSFCPMGPWLVTADEVDPRALDVSCWVNEELRQSASTRDLIFDIPRLISTISRGITLLSGDIIATGTPAGVGIGFDPPRYLKPGDVVRIEIKGIGTLSNPVA